MNCEFCASELPETHPANLALLDHMVLSQPCNEQYGYLLDNLRASWTRNMSGG
ncbi:MAG TPA: hypothetical protein VM370_12400 [Candidatus Thermoplasmatota archaeon]|nr:hypothetical protein [Candidatus Thermoplasmatota archaeon]